MAVSAENTSVPLLAYLEAEGFAMRPDSLEAAQLRARRGRPSHPGLLAWLKSRVSRAAEL